ncbi:MAG: prolyl-tRNA synthetase associated domain-containing protein [Firmicutes bacterium]|nr:prolyl-tRNA synthetase associated domain-containing protein [Bacillota bacterium]
MSVEISSKEQRVYSVLDTLKIDYKIFRHEAVFTVEAAENIDKTIGVRICKNLFLKSKDKFFLLTMPGDKKFNGGKVSKQLSVPRMTFADAVFMEKYLDITPGSVSPLGLINDVGNNVNFIIDKEVFEMEKISVHPCVNTATVLIETRDLLEKILPFCKHEYTIVDF